MVTIICFGVQHGTSKISYFIYMRRVKNTQQEDTSLHIRLWLFCSARPPHSFTPLQHIAKEMPPVELIELNPLCFGNLTTAFIPPSSCQHLYTQDRITTQLWIRDGFIRQSYPPDFLPETTLPTGCKDQRIYDFGACPNGHIAQSTGIISGTTLHACCARFA
jgi:hypothetical protein